MSTFNGYVEEFPEIRIDNFRKIPDKPAPLAMFLSHVHSDHLQGLESFRGIFIYCSPATRELLLRLEKYPHRMNLVKGILECRKQHYKHLKTFMRPLPLNTPTDIELRPGRSVRATLLDANHCAGAVMFLIEDEEKAILYTGDIRSEPWWVNSLVRNPIIIPYTLGIQRLNKIYLDTTFATKDDRYRKFPSKASGIRELLGKVLQYPEDTVFHFHAWTLGYEDVWVALSSALKTQVHIDDYKYRLYKSLASHVADQAQSHEGSALFGFKNGNHIQEGCLTSNRSVRLHSCEHGTGCPASSSSTTVYITPIMSRSESGEVLPEVGAGGGGDDLIQSNVYLELDDLNATVKLVKLCEDQIKDQVVKDKVLEAIRRTLETSRKMMSLNALGLDDYEEGLRLDRLVQRLAKLVESAPEESERQLNRGLLDKNGPAKQLLRRIVSSPYSMLKIVKELIRGLQQFPYSRHSSYDELRDLVGAFRPYDVYPCTTDWQAWTSDVSICSLFGDLCCGTTYAHDQEMARLGSPRASRGLKRPRAPSESQRTKSSQLDDFQTSPISIGGPQESPTCTGQPIAESSSKRHHPAGNNRTASKLLREEDHSTHPTFPKHGLDELRFSFERPLELVKEQGDHIGTSSESSHATPWHPRKEKLRSSARGPPSGTQAKPIELSDNASSKNDRQAKGSFPLQSLPGPGEPAKSEASSQSAPETPLTLSDATFESQTSRGSLEAREKRTQHLHHRKQAYKAARDLNGVWAVEQSLVSLGADHGVEEVEL